MRRRPDDGLNAVDEPPIELIITEKSEPKIEKTENVEASPPEGVPEETPEIPKVEIKPNPNRESKIKRKATGFVKDPPPEGEGRKCCVLM